MNPFMAWIYPMQGQGGLGIWGGGNVPMPNPPIYMPPGSGSQPPGIWGGGNVPMPSPPIANVPGSDNPNQPGFGNRPEHPIYYPPPNIWGPTDPRPGWGLPGGQGGRPTHPIAKPPDENLQGWEEVYVQGIGWTKMIKADDVPEDQKKEKEQK